MMKYSIIWWQPWNTLLQMHKKVAIVYSLVTNASSREPWLTPRVSSILKGSPVVHGNLLARPLSDCPNLNCTQSQPLGYFSVWCGCAKSFFHQRKHSPWMKPMMRSSSHGSRLASRLKTLQWRPYRHLAMHIDTWPTDLMILSLWLLQIMKLWLRNA